MSDLCIQCVAKDAQIARLSDDLVIARQQALHYEHECHALRRELQALRMDRPTDRIHIEPEPHPAQAPTSAIMSPAREHA